MKSFNICILVITLSIFYSCETLPEEEDVICLPVNMTATIVQGTETTKIIADFIYIPGTDRLDHITWSNHQTHYFEYDELERIRVVRQMKVKNKVTEEMWFVYDGSLVERIDLVLRHLDYIFLEPLDSIFTGYIEFEYEGQLVIEENRYDLSQEGRIEEWVWSGEFEYDALGNIIHSTGFDPRTSTSELVDMTYDNSKHPFYGLQYYFTGESFTNNQLSKFIEEGDFNFTYEMNLNEYGYPDIIYEKLGTTNTRIIRYSYMTP